MIQSRATDETGYTQPTHQQLIAERGPLEAPGDVLSHERDPELGHRSGREREECASARLIRRSAVARAAAHRHARFARVSRTRRVIRARSISVSPRREQEIAAVAIAIPADGKGLPPGKGDYAAGKQVYETACAACHGANLQGVADCPTCRRARRLRLIGGRGTLTPQKPVLTVESYWPYATTLFDYIRRAMPFQAPGSLTG